MKTDSHNLKAFANISSPRGENIIHITGIGIIASEIRLGTKSILQTPANSKMPSKALNKNEITSLRALISYVAHYSGSSENSVARQLAKKFNVANVQSVPASRYDDALRFLVDTIEEIKSLKTETEA